MNLPCPHCSQLLELDPETLIALKGTSHFDCPTCGGAVAVPAPVLVPVKQAASSPGRVVQRTQQGVNRNLLVLGVVALLAIGGVALFLASKNGGNVFNIFQNTTNEIINNSYFTQLIAEGVTTKEELETIAEIRPYGDGFIGVSNGALTWDQAREFAQKAGAQVLAVEDNATASGQVLLEWLAESFVDHLSPPVWIREHDRAGIFEGSEVLAVTVTDRPRKAFFHWSPTSKSAADPESVARWESAIDLMPLIDPERDALSGTWKKVNGALLVGASASAHIEIPYHPPAEYDFRITFIRKSGAKSVNQILTKAGRTFVWDFHDGRWGFFFINGTNLENPTVQRLPLENGRKYTSTVHVRNDGVSVTVDGKLVSNWKTDFRDFSITRNWKLRRSTLLGLGSDMNETAFETIELLEISGKGSTAR